jgi:hypothetical protein
VTFEGIFDNTIKISLIINIIFILVVLVGFSFIWLPFFLEQNESYKPFPVTFPTPPNPLTPVSEKDFHGFRCFPSE